MSYFLENSIILTCDVCGDSETISVDHNSSLISRAKRNGWIIAPYKRCYCSPECCKQRTVGHAHATYGDSRLEQKYTPDLIGRLDAFYRDQHGMKV